MRTLLTFVIKSVRMKNTTCFIGTDGSGKDGSQYRYRQSVRYGNHFLIPEIYKEMRIGTAVPSSGQLAAVRHHFIKRSRCTIIIIRGNSKCRALERIRELFQEKEVVLMTGGSMLYIDAVQRYRRYSDHFSELRTGLMEVYERKVWESIRRC